MFIIFADKYHAGKLLADILRTKELHNTKLIAIPRGGVEVADPIAQALKSSIHVIIPRKIGSPFNTEYALGAVAPDGSTYLDDFLLSSLNMKESQLKPIIDREMEEIKTRMEKYQPWSLLPDLTDSTVILIDDGIATGHTVKAALKGIKNKGAKKLLLAVPVLPHDIVDEFQALVDELVYLEAPQFFQALGQFYEDFSPTTHDTVLQILKKYATYDDI